MNMKRRYRCPICGKRVVLGEHFCLVKTGNQDSRAPAEDEEEGSPAKEKAKTIFTGIVASILLAALLWQSIGIYSLAALALVPLVYLVNLIGGRKRLGGRRPS